MDTIYNLTNTEDIIENDPSWSNDGNHIVFARGEFITPEGLPSGSFIAAKADLWVMDSNGDNAKMVVSFDGSDACSDYADNYCVGLPADSDFLPNEEGLVFEKLLSTSKNKGSGRWNIFSASLDGTDNAITNLTNNPTAYQAIPRASEHGIIFHEVDVEKPFYGLVMIDFDGGNRKIILDNSTWEYYLGTASWLK